MVYDFGNWDYDPKERPTRYTVYISNLGEESVKLNHTSIVHQLGFYIDYNYGLTCYIFAKSAGNAIVEAVKFRKELFDDISGIPFPG